LLIVLLACLPWCGAQGSSGAGATPGKSEVAGKGQAQPNVPRPYSELEGKGEGFAAPALYYLKVIFYLILISAMIWGLVWVLKRYGAKGGLLAALAGMRSSSGRGSMRILETLPLAQGRALHLIEIGEKVVIVGATPQSVTLVAVIDDAAEVEAIRKQSYKASPFARRLEEGEETYAAPPGEAAVSLRSAADSLLAKSRSLRRRKDE